MRTASASRNDNSVFVVRTLSVLMLLVLFLACAVPLCSAKLPREECTIMKNPMALPPIGVVSANPERSEIIARKWFDWYYVHTDFRGYRVYAGEYKGTPMFAAFIGLGSASAAFIMEELIAFDAQAVIRLGSNDYNVTEANRAYIVQECHGLVGVMQDYGIPESEWGVGLQSDQELVQLMEQVSRDQFPDIHVERSVGYNIDGFYSFFNPERVAAVPEAVKRLQAKYEGKYGATVRDMETCSVLFAGRIHGIKTASMLQAVIKHGSDQEDVGTVGIPIVLETLRKIAPAYEQEISHWKSAHVHQQQRRNRNKKAARARSN